MVTFYGTANLLDMQFRYYGYSYKTRVTLTKLTEQQEPTQLFKLFTTITVQHLRRAIY